MFKMPIHSEGPPLFALHRHKRPVGQRGQFDDDRIAGFNRAARDHGAHHARFSNQPTRGIAPEHRGHQPGLEIIDLVAPIAQTGEFHVC